MSAPKHWNCAVCHHGNEATDKCLGCGQPYGTGAAANPPPPVAETALAEAPRKGAEMTETGIRIHSLGEAMQWGRMICGVDKEGRSVGPSIAPKGDTPGAVVLKVQAGLELGFGVARSMSVMTAVNGRVGIMGDAAKALVIQSGALRPGTGISWGVELGPKGLDDPETHGWARTHRLGDPEPVTTTFSVAEAKQARLWGKAGPWSEYAERMLKYRAWGFHARDQYPDILCGFPISEELRDYPPVSTGERGEAPEGDDPLLIEGEVESADEVAASMETE